MKMWRTASVFLLSVFPSLVSLCAPGDTMTFELVTGAIFMSDVGKINSFQTFDMSECIAACRNDSTCTSANFETGLCTTSRNNASAMPDALRTDDFPVFPNYLEKICLGSHEPVAAKEWSFQRTVNYYLPGYNMKVISAVSQQDCLTACLNEQSFICASVEMRYDNQSCSLSNTSQSLLQTRLQKADAGVRIDYFENNWLKEPRTFCEFNRIRGRVLKSADLVRSKVSSLEDCKALCLKANFSCNYYHYGQLSDDECSMSHHTAMTVSHITEPYVFSADFVSYELRACFGIDLICEAKKMTARVSTNRMFDGLVYAKDQPKTCLFDVMNSTVFELGMPLDGTQCGTANNGKGTYRNYIMIQYNDKIVTSKDMGLSVSCEYDLGSRNVTGSLSTNGAPSITENVNYKVPAPIVQMSIRDSNGDPVVSATVGDKIYLQFELGAAQMPDIYNIFVKDVVAIDGVGKSKIKMIDSNGCPSDDIVLGPVESINSGKTLRIPIEAFKFPTNDEVEFMALIKPCQKQCDPAQCIDDATQIVYNSYGKKRRKREAYTGTDLADKKTDQDVLVHQRININDMFTNCLNGDCSSPNTLELKIQPVGRPVPDMSGIVCIHKLAIAVAASVVLLIQVIFAVALAFICQRYRIHRKSRFKATLDISSTSKPSKSSVTSKLSSTSSELTNEKDSSSHDSAHSNRAIYDLCRADSLNNRPSSR